MLERIKRIIGGPVFADDMDKTRVAGLLNIILLIVLALVVVYGAITLLTQGNVVNTLAIEGTIALLCLGLMGLMRRGRVRLAAFLLSFGLWAIITVGSWFSGGLRGSGMSSYLGLILIAGILLGGSGGFVFSLLTIAAAAAMLYGEMAGLLPPPPAYITSTYLFIEFAAVVVGMTGLLHLTTRSLSTALETARRNELAQTQANRELQTLRLSLEQQVADRTRELEQRAAYLQTSVEIGRAATSVLDVDQLCQRVVDIIGEGFKLYHVALFTLDETRQWALYRAGSGEVGRILREQKLRLQVEGRSMVGWCIVNARPRIAQDIRIEITRMPHPLLPDTCSEAALPLMVRGQVIGALNIQSEHFGTFEPGFVAALQTIADQVAIALDNARLLAESQAALQAERRALGEQSLQAWLQLLRGGVTPGYSYAAGQITPIEADSQLVAIEAALRSGQSAVFQAHTPQGQPASILAIPVKVRERVIGLIDLHKEATDARWSREEIDLLEGIAEQLGIALDGARLYQETQRRAAREQIINTITASLRSATPTVQSILEKTAQELGHTFSASRALIRLEMPQPAEST